MIACLTQIDLDGGRHKGVDCTEFVRTLANGANDLNQTAPIDRVIVVTHELLGGDGPGLVQRGDADESCVGAAG